MGLFLKYWIPYPTVDATVVEATNQLQANKITQVDQLLPVINVIKDSIRSNFRVSLEFL